ncbi:MAG: hypothetical protein JRD93_04800 [Deltaproteobacteria bacterium]|nr:hypothetical protein [Deltaproteobacteria bacterium]MBW2661305.1 hypothetical protein [Deltaproteobacteria bacterium]
MAACIYEDRLVPGLREMTDAVHNNDGKIVLQLAYAGIYCVVEKRPREKSCKINLDGVIKRELCKGLAAPVCHYYKST